MKLNLFLCCILSTSLYAETEFERIYEREHGKKQQETPKQILESHAKGSIKVAREQDELSADVQELIQGETNEKVINFLAEAEELMAQATDRLEALDTSAATIAIETEIIEKIAAAAEQKQQSSNQADGQQQSGGLMEMMKQMMGKGQQGQQPGDKPGKGEAGSGGEGQEADSNSANESSSEESADSTTTRRLPKKSGSAGTVLPREFREALEAYNKGLNNAQ